MSNLNYGKSDTNIEYLFIDSGYLMYRLKDWAKYFDTNMIEINYETFFSGYDKIFYYDGVSKDDVIKEQLLNKLRELPNFHVVTGTVKGEGKKRRQKQVDILIAINMLMHTIRNNMNACTLLSGDEDFKPLIDALILEGMNVTIWSDKKSTSKDLLYSADMRRDLSILEIWRLSTSSFLKKYPYPKITTLSFGARHQTMHSSTQSVKIDQNRRLYLNSVEDEKIDLMLEENSKMTQMIFESREDLKRYFQIIDDLSVIECLSNFVD